MKVMRAIVLVLALILMIVPPVAFWTALDYAAKHPSEGSGALAGMSFMLLLTVTPIGLVVFIVWIVMQVWGTESKVGRRWFP
jgi:hypothetical protein